MQEVEPSEVIEFGTAVLLFLAALIPFVQWVWAKVSTHDSEEALFVNILNILAGGLYTIGLLFWIATGIQKAALAIYGIGLLFQIAGFLREEKKIKGATLSLVICSIAFASLIQFYFLERVVENQNRMIEIQSEVIEHLTNE